MTPWCQQEVVMDNLFKIEVKSKQEEETGLLLPVTVVVGSNPDRQ